MYDYIVSLLQGVDLEAYPFLPALILGILILLCFGLFFRAVLTMFNIFFCGK